MAVKKFQIFYGWWIVVGTFISMTIGLGIAVYSFPVFFKYIINEFGWSRAKISWAKSTLTWAAGLIGPLLGKGVDKYGPRKIMLPGAVVIGLSLMLLFFTHSFWYFLILFFFVGIGFASITILPSATVISHWFKKKRGRAMGIAMIGLSMGGVIMPTLTHYLISHFGWRWAYVILGAIIWVFVIPIVALLIRNRPEDMGLLPDGNPSQEKVFISSETASVPSLEGVSSLDAFKMLSFWMLSIAYLITQASMTAVIIHLVAFLTDLGVSPGKAALALSFITFIGMLCRPVYGFFADKFSKKYVLGTSYLLMGLGLLILQGTRFSGIPWLFMIIFGFGLGGKAVLEPLLVADCFGLASYGTILGYMRIIQVGGGGLGPVFAGYIFDFTESYHWAFISFIIGFVLAIGAILFARSYEVETSGCTEPT